MDIDDRPVGRVLSRREVLALLGAVGAGTLVAACSPGSSGPDATSAATSSGASTSTATPETTTAATAPSTATTAATSTTATAEAETPTEAAAGSTSDTSTATATVEADETALALLPACVVSPELTEGPYFVDEMLNRSDVRSDPTSGEVREGVPLQLALRISRIGSSGCSLLANAMVDIWQCDALGAYSDVQDMNDFFDTEGQQFLRGYQVSDAHGLVTFQTIYPGWYEGRAVHIHFKVRGDAADGQTFEFTSQFFFDDELTDLVHQQEPYAAKGSVRLRNTSDGIYQEGGSQLLLNLTEAEDGYAALFDIGIALD